MTSDADMAATLRRMAEDFDDIAVDLLEAGAVDVRHPSLMPQLDHVR
jgi:hypothetical protein